MISFHLGGMLSTKPTQKLKFIRAQTHLPEDGFGWRASRHRAARGPRGSGLGHGSCLICGLLRCGRFTMHDHPVEFDHWTMLPATEIKLFCSCSVTRWLDYFLIFAHL